MSISKLSFELQKASQKHQKAIENLRNEILFTFSNYIYNNKTRYKRS